MKSVIASLVILMRVPSIDLLRSTMKTKRKSLPSDYTEDTGTSSSTNLLSYWVSYVSKFGTKEALTAILFESAGSSSYTTLGSCMFLFLK
jgi:hypothetical protein